MSDDTKLLIATPVLAWLDIERSVELFCSVLGFAKVHVQQGVYISRGPVGADYWEVVTKSGAWGGSYSQLPPKAMRTQCSDQSHIKLCPLTTRSNKTYRRMCAPW